MNYKAMLQIGYEHAVVNAKECGASGLSKLNFLADDLFDFTTYENEVAELMARKAVEVCQAITDNKTFDYIKTDEGHLWYLIMVNMPFFTDKIDWGTSIRGAYWNTYRNPNLKINSSAFTREFKPQIKDKESWMVYDEFEIPFKDNESWISFITALIEFATEQPL